MVVSGSSSRLKSLKSRLARKRAWVPCQSRERLRIKTCSRTKRHAKLRKKSGTRISNARSEDTLIGGSHSDPYAAYSGCSFRTQASSHRPGASASASGPNALDSCPWIQTPTFASGHISLPWPCATFYQAALPLCVLIPYPRLLALAHFNTTTLFFSSTA